MIDHRTDSLRYALGIEPGETVLNGGWFGDRYGFGRRRDSISMVKGSDGSFSMAPAVEPIVVVKIRPMTFGEEIIRRTRFPGSRAQR